MSDPNRNRADAAIRRYGRLEERMSVLGGYAAEAEAASIASSLGLPDRVLHQPLGTLSGGQRRRVELARILFGDSPGAAAATSRPTTSTPTRSPGCGTTCAATAAA